MAGGCDDLSGPAWVWCTATEAYTRSVESSSDAAVAIADRVSSSYDGAVQAGKDVVQTGQKGAEQGGRMVTDAWKSTFNDAFKLTPGAVLTIGAVGVGAALLADAYFTGGAVSRRVGRQIAGSGGRR